MVWVGLSPQTKLCILFTFILHPSFPVGCHFFLMACVLAFFMNFFMLQFKKKRQKQTNRHTQKYQESCWYCLSERPQPHMCCTCSAVYLVFMFSISHMSSTIFHLYFLLWMDWLLLPPQCHLPHFSLNIPISKKISRQTYGSATCFQHKAVSSCYR